MLSYAFTVFLGALPMGVVEARSTSLMRPRISSYCRMNGNQLI